MTPASRRIAWAAGAVALAAGITLGAWVLVRSRGDQATAEAGRPAADMKDMPGMAGMSGMQMSGSGTVLLSPSQIRQFGIAFGTAERRRLTGEVRATGVVAADETRVVEVAPRFGGFVEQLRADFTGRAVRRGEPLLAIYSPEVFATMQELIVARRMARDTTPDVPGATARGTDLVAAARQRLQLFGVDDATIDAALESGQAPRTVTLFAPVAGVVTEKRVLRGQAVSAGQTLYTIADLSSVWVNADVREADAAVVRAGTGAEVEVAALPGRPLKGVVTYVQPVMRTETRTVTARISVANTNARLKPGMFATVLLRPGGREALVVPTAAVVRTGERAVVFVDMGGGELMPHEVQTGTVSGDFTEIVSGVGVGDRVVTSAQFLLDSESNLGEVMRSMLGQGSAAARDMEKMPGMEPKRP
jgi:Cu(I)/Ag(I) efflux system membrane fusion protein